MIHTPSRTAAVLAADAAGYSRAMSVDEPRALAALASSRRIMDALIAAGGGRIFSTGGDSVLAEFGASDAAVRCGVQIQSALARAATAGTEILAYRIGVHVGRVYPNHDDLLGETVNIAARLESLANPGGLCISDTVRDRVAGLRDLVIEDMGARVLKGIREPIRVARIRLGETDQAAEPQQGVSLAILPFRAPAQDRHWGEGLADDLIAALSRFSGLAVFARTSGFGDGIEPDPRRVAADLGVRFVVTGSVRVQGTQFHLAVQLLDGASGVVLWADRHRAEADDLMGVQDRLVAKIAGTLAGRLAEAGTQSALRKRTESLDAFDLLLRGMHHANRLDPASGRRAIDCFDQALAIDPDYAAALAMSALMRLRVWSFDPGPLGLGPVAALAERALALDPADSWCHLVRGQVAMYQGRLDAADVHHKKAHALNPCDARILALWSPLATFLGKPEEGRARIERAIQLDPHHPAWYLSNLGLACYCARQYEEGAAVYASVADPQAGVLAGLVACRTRLDDRDGAALARATLLAAQPDFSSARFIAVRPFKYAADREHLRDGLLRGGLAA